MPYNPDTLGVQVSECILKQRHLYLMWFSNAVSTSVALTIVFRKHFDVSQEANYSVFTKFLYYANVGPEDKVDLKFLNEMGVHTPRVSQLSLLLGALSGCVRLRAAVGTLISPLLVLSATVSTTSDKPVTSLGLGFLIC